MQKRLLLLLIVVGMMISCGSVRRQMLNAELTRAEDMRDAEQLVRIVRTLVPTDQDDAVHAALAAGRIPSYAAWQELALRFGEDPKVSQALAIATRFPENGFTKTQVLNMLKGFSTGKEVVISMLALDTQAAFSEALSHPEFDKVVAANLWRAKTVVTPDDVAAAYRVHPAETVYSAYRLKLKGIVLSEDLEKMEVFQKVYGIAVCDKPADFLTDPDWRVKVAALRADNSRKGAVTLLDDDNPLVRVTALESYLKNGGTVWRKAKRPMSPMEVETLLRTSDNAELAVTFFEKGGEQAEVSAPYMPKLKERTVMESGVPDAAKIAFLDHRLGEDKALEWGNPLPRYSFSCRSPVPSEQASGCGEGPLCGGGKKAGRCVTFGSG